MSPALNHDITEAFDTFLASTIACVDDLYDLDGETAFRRRGGTTETFDAEQLYAGGRP